ncbi:MAG: PD-(D/E)XK nuclease-like domain-containing protein [Actinomycetia bacterium]|nr:PD-(D/E)XK nuclease-like domain-containing protein [Actinomycetes bacterium]
MSETTAQGMELGLSFEEYQSREGLNKSSAVNLLKTPAHFMAAKQAQRKVTPALNRGLALHCKLSDDRHCLAVTPKVDRRTKVGKAVFAEFEQQAVGRIIVTPEVDDQTEAMAEAILAHPIADAYRRQGQHEGSIFFDFDGVLCKARVDCLTDECIVDWKSTGDIEAFERSIATYHYDLQVAWYTEAVRAVTGKALPFRFVVVEDTPPYAVRVFEAGETLWERGSHHMQKCVDIYRQCRERDEWPGYPPTIETAELPHYARLEVSDVIEI